METKLYQSSTRGHANHGWLDTYYSFSFANYRNPERMHFGALRVLNDDTIQGGSGFGKHPHDNMEIITIPLEGKVLHEDSMGHKQTISPDEVQVMSAGSGIFHSEYNASQTEPLRLLQIWIMTGHQNIAPSYDQKLFDRSQAQGKWQWLVSPKDHNALKIHQDASIARTFINKGATIEYFMPPGTRGSFIFLIDGQIEIGSNVLSKRDSMEITHTEEFNLKAIQDSYVLNIEVPMAF